MFTLLGRIAIENDQANRALDETAERAEGTGQRTSAAFDGIGRAALGIGKFVLTAGAALGGAWVAAIESTREFRTNLAMLDTAFEASGHSSEAARKTYSDLNAVLGDSGQATEAAQMLALLADNEKELSTWTDICTGVYARMGEAIPLEELAQSSSETAKSGILTGGLVDALIQAGHGEEEFQAKLDACTSEQERQKLIMDTLNGSYAKASEQYKKTNADVLAANRAQEKLTGAMAELGRIGEPVLTAIKTKVADMVTAAVPHLENLIQKVRDVKKWVQDNRTTINNWKAAIAGATVSIGAFILALKWSAIMSSAKKAITGVRTAVLLFNATLLANPIALVVALIAGLVTAFVLLWRNNEGFRNFWISLWGKLKSSCGSAVSWIKGKFGDLKSALKTVRNVFGDIKDAISDKLDAARDKVKTVIDKIKNLFKFKWSLPSLKVPKISVDGGKAPYGLGGKGKLPSFKVKWNAEGGILTRPTLFGQLGNTLLGGGEAGHEAILPLDRLEGYVREAVRVESNTELLGRIIIEQNERLMELLRMIVPHDVRLNTGALVGELVPAIDSGLADRYSHSMRGNTR